MFEVKVPVWYLLPRGSLVLYWQQSSDMSSKTQEYTQRFGFFRFLVLVLLYSRYFIFRKLRINRCWKFSNIQVDNKVEFSSILFLVKIAEWSSHLILLEIENLYYIYRHIFRICILLNKQKWRIVFKVSMIFLN